MIAIVVSAATDRLDEPALKDGVVRHFRTMAPSYMLPERIVLATELPRSPNGKFDRGRCCEMLSARETELQPP